MNDDERLDLRARLDQAEELSAATCSHGLADDCMEPCPFCGHDAARLVYDGPIDCCFAVECQHCYCRTDHWDGPDSARSSWNQRSAPVDCAGEDVNNFEEAPWP